MAVEGGGEEGREVCIGGLLPGTTDDDVLQNFASAGEVIEVRVARRDDGTCTGSATVTFQNREAAEKACQIRAFGQENIPIGVVISKSVDITSVDPSASMPVPLRLSESTHSLTKIFTTLREQSDRKAFVAGSMTAYMNSVSGKTCEEEVINKEDCRAEIREAAVLQPDMNNYLDKLPKCRMLMVKIRSMPNNDNKTPAGVLNEYATKLNLELQYDDRHEAGRGCFVSTCKMSSMDGNYLYAEGEGRALKKRDAKQMSAAAALENLLEQVPESDFMQPGKNRFLRQSGYRGRGRHLRPGLGSGMQRAGNRLQGPRPIAAGKRKFGEVFASNPPVNHSPPSSATARGGGMVHGLGMIALPNQAVVTATGTGTHTGAMGMDTPTAMVNPAMMTAMAPMMHMGAGMVVNNGNSLIQPTHGTGLIGHAPPTSNVYGLELPPQHAQVVGAGCVRSVGWWWHEGQTRGSATE